MTDFELMGLALEEAAKAAALGEVPVGAVLVRDGVVLARDGNRTLELADPTAHAEVLALRAEQGHGMAATGGNGHAAIGRECEADGVVRMALQRCRPGGCEGAQGARIGGGQHMQHRTVP